MSVAETIENKLRGELSPTFLEVHNESGMHAVPKGSETHFKVVVVSASFEGMSRVARHQRVYAALQAELRAGVHALAIVSRTPSEWASENVIPPSPPCQGGTRESK